MYPCSQLTTFTNSIMTFLVTWLCLALLMLSTEYGDAAVSCDSRLRFHLPHLFSHCNESSPCAYGPWSEWSYTGVLKNDSRCNSGKVRQHKRARTASTPACESHLLPESEAEYECEPNCQISYNSSTNVWFTVLFSDISRHNPQHLMVLYIL